jgi:hypothetical protein
MRLLMAPNLVAAAGPPGDALFFAVLMLFVINIALYATPLFLAFLGTSCLLHGKKIRGLVLVAFAAAPFVNYAYHWSLNGSEPARRGAEISGWTRVRPELSGPFQRLELYGAYPSPAVAQLSAAGLIGATITDPESRFRRTREVTYGFAVDHGVHCIDRLVHGIDLDGRDFVSAALARRAFHDCEKGELRAESEWFSSSTDLPTLVLKDGPGLRYQGPACQERGDTFELRLGGTNGRGLVDFDEPALGGPLAFPPRIGAEHGAMSWECQRSRALDPDWPAKQQKLFTMISRALGRHRPEDFPLAATPVEVVAAVSTVARMTDSRGSRNALLALLGQWPSTLAIAAALLDLELRMSRYHMDGAFALLLDPVREERRRAYYPYLHTHASALLAICKTMVGARCDDRERDIIKKVADGVFQSR